MTRQSKTLRPDTINGINAAMKHLAGRNSSIRKACKAGNISPATLYNNVPDTDIAAARKGKFKSGDYTVQAMGINSGASKRRSPKKNPSAPVKQVIQTQVDSGIDMNYVAKLERFALKRFLDEQEE